MINLKHYMKRVANRLFALKLFNSIHYVPHAVVQTLFHTHRIIALTDLKANYLLFVQSVNIVEIGII